MKVRDLSSALQADPDSLPYPEFLGHIGLDNTPPGGHVALWHWAEYASIASSSTILDLACNTAWVSRTLVERFACRAYALDCARPPLLYATHVTPPESRIRLIQGDASKLPFCSTTFTHIAAGSVFGFFTEPEAALRECERVLRPDGRLCIATFFYHSPPPPELTSVLEKYIGFRPKEFWTRSFWRDFFATRFRLTYSATLDLVVREPEDVVEQCTALRSGREGLLLRPIDSRALRRLITTQLLLNQHRRYQGYEVQVWERR